MLQKVLIISTAVIALLANIAMAQTPLSSNPWIESNDEDTVAEIYRKEQRRNKNRGLNYQAEDTATIDRTHAYIQDDEIPQNKDEGLLDKVKNAFNGNKNEQNGLMANTAANRQALAQQAQTAKKKERTSSDLLSNPLGNLQKSFGMPKMPNINGMIKQLEKSSGVNLKNIGKYLK